MKKRKQKRLTPGQILNRYQQHAKAKHGPGVGWCGGCFTWYGRPWVMVTVMDRAGGGK